jgi:hypothetical protein
MIADLSADWRHLDERLEAVTSEIEALTRRAFGIPPPSAPYNPHWGSSNKADPARSGADKDNI